MLSLDLKTIIIGYSSILFAFIFVYLKWFNIVQRNEAARYGIRNAGVYWARIDTEDPHCPSSLRRAVRKTNRLAYLSGAVFVTVVVLAESILP
jgi:hypothetical protein